MAETHETITDIIAEKRRLAAEMEKALGDQHSSVEILKDDADRIEAAYKREKAAIEADALEVGGIVGASHKRELSKNTSKNGADFGQLGDAAKLREALESIASNLEHRLFARYPRSASDEWMYQKANTALSAPPRYCEYYGEPNGCNSPIYGEHPSTPNAAAMHACLLKILAEMIDLGGMEAGRKARFSPDAIAEEIRQALSAPPRNCDVGSAQEQTKRFEAFCQSNMQFYKDMFGHDDEGRLDGWDCREDCPVGRMIDSGTAVADHCQLAWAQMPYEEGGAK